MVKTDPPKPSALRLLCATLIETTLGHRMTHLALRTDLVLVIRVPNKGWLTPLREAAEERLPAVRHLSIFRHERDDGERSASLYLESGPSSLWLTHDLDLLPGIIRLVADDELVLAPITTTMLAKVIGDVTDSAPSRLRRAEHDGLDLFELAAAIRPNSSAAQCVGRLRRMASRRAAEVSYHPDPDLLALPIVGEAAQTWIDTVTGTFAAIAEGRGEASLLRHTVLFGPPGTGKSQLARIAAARSGVPVIEASIPGLFSGSDGHLNSLLAGIDAFVDRLIRAAPVVGIIDEIDAISARNAQREHRAYWTSLVDGLLLAIDRLSASGAAVLLVATTNLLSQVDEAVARPGRLGHHVHIEPPTDPRDVAHLLRYHLDWHAPTLALGDQAMAPLVRRLLGCTAARIADTVHAACAAAVIARRPPDLGDLLQATPLALGTTDQPSTVLADTARHEAAHAVLAFCLGRRPVAMSLIPRGSQLGHTTISALVEPATLSDLEDEVTILLAGRAMDQLSGPGLCAGAADDLEQALTLLGHGYTRWGLKTCPLSMPGESLVARAARDPELASAINTDLTRLQQRASTMVSGLLDPIGALAAALLAERHLDADSIRATLAPFDLNTRLEAQP